MILSQRDDTRVRSRRWRSWTTVGGKPLERFASTKKEAVRLINNDIEATTPFIDHLFPETFKETD